MATTRLVSLILAAGVCTATVTALAGPDCSGEFVLDRAGSLLQAESAVVEGGTVRIEHRDPAFRFARTFVVKQQPIDTTYESAADGREVARTVAGRSSRSRLEWQGTLAPLDRTDRHPAWRGEQHRAV